MAPTKSSLGARLLNRLLAPPAPAPAAAPAGRQDATAGSWRRRLDSVRNTFTGMGSDKVTAGRPDLYQQELVYMELCNLWRYSGHSRRFVECVPQDATRQGWGINTGDGDPVDLKALHKRLRLVQRVAEADTWGRLLGAAWILMVTEDDMAGTPYADDPRGWVATPLDLGRVRKLRNLVVLDWSEATPTKMDNDPNSPTYREPLQYNVAPQAGAGLAGDYAGATVHASRMVYFPGSMLPARDRAARNGLADSILQVVWDQIRNTQSLDHSLAALAAEMRITVLRMRDLSDVQVSDEAEYFDYRMREMAKHRSVLNTVLLADGEEYQHHTGTVAGMAELVGTTRQSLQAVTAMPEQLWVGSAPGGLSTDGESHRNLWANVISAYQTTKYQDRLERLYEVAFAATEGEWGGQAPADWQLSFNPLDELSSHGQATLRKTIAETDAIYIAAGVLDPQHVAKGRFGPRGWQQDLPPVETVDSPVDLDMGAVLAALAGGGPPPQQPGSQAASGADATLAERRRLAASMTDADVTACEHGSKNRCRLCGVERRRSLMTDDTGATVRGPGGEAQWVIQWAALDDYEVAEAAQADAMQGRAMRWRLPADATPRRADADDDTVAVWVGVPLPEEARGTWEAVRLQAAVLTGSTLADLDLRGHAPHITVAYLGRHPRSSVQAVADAAAETLDRLWGDGLQIDLLGTGLGAFSPTPESDLATPLYLGICSDVLEAVNEALQPLTQGPRRWWRGHATVGYLDRALTPAEWDLIWASKLGRGQWSAQILQLQVGGVTVRTWGV